MCHKPRPQAKKTPVDTLVHTFHAIIGEQASRLLYSTMTKRQKVNNATALSMKTAAFHDRTCCSTKLPRQR